MCLSLQAYWIFAEYSYIPCFLYNRELVSQQIMKKTHGYTILYTLLRLPHCTAEAGYIPVLLVRGQQWPSFQCPADHYQF